ncbi:MAG: translation initiation factor IF-1 [Myxococcales bacterium]|nr:MAG: translation initiation factor IF-1 [Myxococcales bacterium]
MSRDDLIQLDGTVVEVLTDGNFKVETDTGQALLARLAGKLRKFRIRVILGDRVTVGVSPYDPSHGLILHRHREDNRGPAGPPPRRGNRR